MPTRETTAQFNKVFVIESLEAGDVHGGTHLVEEIKPTIDSLRLGLAFWQVGDRAAFDEAMRQVWAQCAREFPRTYPILHIEAHGSHDRKGILLSPSGEVVPWESFAQACRAINRESHNNLLVTTGLCFGLRAISAVSILAPAPFFALLGPEVEVSGQECDCISMFYNELLRTGDTERAQAKLSEKFGLFLAERLFIRGYADYVQKHTRGSGRRERLEKLLSQATAIYGSTRGSLAELRRKIKERLKPDPSSFERMKHRFLMSDHPDNEGRFQGTFADALQADDSNGRDDREDAGPTT
jgi:hypothetical protein